MPVVAVLSRKGGSGKSTVATHLAAWFAHLKVTVLLGDIDRQQSSRNWLRRRDPALPRILPWVMDQKSVTHTAPGVTHIVLDTPSALGGLDLARVVMSADVLVVPLGLAYFDRESGASFCAELKALPRVASGRCRLGVLGENLPAPDDKAASLHLWAKAQRVPYLGGLLQAPIYQRLQESGQSLFDLSDTAFPQERAQWNALLQWLQPMVLDEAGPEILPALSSALSS